MEKTDCFSPKIKEKTGFVSALTNSVNIILANTMNKKKK